MMQEAQWPLVGSIYHHSVWTASLVERTDVALSLELFRKHPRERTSPKERKTVGFPLKRPGPKSARHIARSYTTVFILTH